MWIVYLGFGFALGTLFGIALLALLVASKDGDREWERHAERRGAC